MREKIGKGGFYKGAPGRTQGQGISWAEKSSFCEQSSKSDWKPASRGCLEIRAREMLSILKDPKWLSGAGAEGLPQSGSDRDYVRDSSQA